eukprot:Nitzschia sp. Nitz4//NODE_159_length_47236_cov_74.723851//14302//15858//NITZ4_additional_000006-RA//1//CDS//3329531737//7222//frame0
MPCASPAIYWTPLLLRSNVLPQPSVQRGPSVLDPVQGHPSRAGVPRHSSTFLQAQTQTQQPGQTEPTQPEKYHWNTLTFSLAIPALIGMLADPLLSLMDTAYVGRIGANELAALGPCTSIFHLAFNAFRATTAATTSLVGNSKSEEERRHIIGVSLKLGVSIGFMVMAVLSLAGPWCLSTMGVHRTSSLFKPASAYLGARLWAAPVVLGLVVAEGAFRGYGDTRIPLLASLAASVINLIMDPLLMFPLGMGVAGAAAATGLSQVGAALVYAYYLYKRRMLPQGRTNAGSAKMNSSLVVKEIFKANLAMICKQGSLLLAWAYASSRATRLGAAHVAAHQVALSFWMVFALLLDAPAVAAQVLMSKSLENARKVRSLIVYMLRFAVTQGLVCTSLVLMVAPYLPGAFTTDPAIAGNLRSLMPQLAWQQLLVSLTLVIESLATGGTQFQILAGGTTMATVLAMWQLRNAHDIVSIWSKGIVTLFAGRLLAACIAVLRLVRRPPKRLNLSVNTSTSSSTNTP